MLIDSLWFYISSPHHLQAYPLDALGSATLEHDLFAIVAVAPHVEQVFVPVDMHVADLVVV